MVEISFIIPAYNASGTIVRTLDSIAAVCEGKVEYEIIVIDDASIDDTCEIVEQYAQQLANDGMSRDKSLNESLTLNDVNLILLRQPENHRQGAARNRGMEMAKGEYVMFVDADDTIGEGVLEQWRLAKAQKADVVCGKMDKIERGETTDVYATKLDSGVFVSGKEFCEKYFDFEVHVHPVIYLWRRAYMEKKKIQYIADRRFEDADWIEQNLFYAQSVGYVDAVVYHYYHAESTGSTTNTLSPDTLGDWINLAYRQWVFAEKIKEESPIFCEKLIDSSRHIVKGHLSLRRLTRLSPNKVGNVFARVGENEMEYMRAKGDWGRFTTICFKAPRLVIAVLALVYPMTTIGRRLVGIKRKLLVLLLSLIVVNGYALDVVFRYDDFRLINNALQNQLIEVFAEEQIPLHIAVIPCNEDSTYVIEEGEHLERVKELQKQGVLQIALHGYSHTGKPTIGEMPQYNYDEQRYRLERGSMFLDSVFGKHVHIFIPPWNKYNQTTLDILAELGYDVISSALNDNQLVSDENFQYYPEGCDHPTKLRKVVAKNAKREGLVVCMFHRYDFTEAYTMDDLRELLKEVKANEDMHIMTMDELYARDKSFDCERIEANLTRPLLTKIMLTRPIILPTNVAKKLRVYDLLIHLLLVLVIALIGGWLIGWRNHSYWIAQGVVLALAGLQTWCQFVMPKIGICMIVVMAILVVWAFYKSGRKRKVSLC